MASPLPWFKVDVSVTEHPKLAGLSDAGWTLWLHGMAYAARNLTDGFIPAAVLPRLCSTRSPRAAANELVKAGAWDVWDDGWLIHDYLDHQRSADDVEANAKQKSKSGSMGNHKRWHVAKRKWVPECPHCVAECDPSAIANGSQGDRETIADVEVDVEEEAAIVGSPPPSTASSDGSVVVRGVIQLWADHDYTSYARRTLIDDEDATRYSIRKRLTVEKSEYVTGWAERHPNDTAEQLWARIANAYEETA